MNAIYHVITLDVWQSILWVLVHTLWQGLAMACLLWGLLKCVPVKRATWRYWLSTLCLAMIILSALATWSIQRLPEKGANPVDQEVVSDVTAQYALPSPPASQQTQTAPPALQKDPWQVGAACAVWIWVLGVLTMLLRIAFSLGAAQGLVQGARPLDDPALMQCIDALKTKLRLQAQLSAKVLDTLCVPAVVGVLRPTLLLPLALINEMSPEQIEVVLAHELAHVRRCDMLFTLIQRVIEALLFFNPAVWWISRQVSLEREACCDAVAVAVTGPRETVAKALYDVVAKLHTPAPALHAAVALHKGHRRGHFTERLRRLVEPKVQAHLRLPWASFAMLLAMTGLGLAVLHWGTSRAVTKAAELLTPKQLVKLVEQAKQENTAPRDPMIAGAPNTILVRGTIRTFDGSPLPEDLRIQLMGETQGGIASYDADIEGSVFHCKISERRVSLIPIGKTFAPLVVGPLKIETGQVLDNIELILQPGLEVKIKLQDPSGLPIKGARVDYRYHLEHSTFNHDSLISDENGLLIFEHAATLPLSLFVRHKGFQFDHMKTEFDEDNTMDWTLTPAQPTAGTVISKETGQPIANAPIYLLGRRGFQNQVYDVRQSYEQKQCLLATTDAQGRFVLDSLRDDCLYGLYVDGTEQYGPDIFSGIVAGQTDLRLGVSPARYVQGRILGDYEPEQRRLPGRGVGPVLQYGNVLRFDNYSFSSGFHTRLTKLEDQTGWAFKIPSLLPNDVTLSLKGHPTRTIPKLTEAIEDYTIDLRPNADDPSKVQQETRTVVVKLEAPEGWPVPTGKIRLDYVMTDRNAYKPHWLELKDGQAQLDVPMLPHGQGRFMYQSSQDLIGYWIERKSAIPIPPGDTPHVIEVQALPAGAIHGTVLGPDGKPMFRANVYLNTIERSPDTQDRRLDLDRSVKVSPEGRFVFTPVPLGGRYQLKAYRSQGNENYLVFSQALTVTREVPTQDVTLTIPTGQTVQGRIVNADGQGLAQAKIALNYEHEHGSHGGASITADAQGHFQFTHVNTDAPCDYAFRVSPTGNYCGREVPATLKDTQTIVLQEGLTVQGKVIEAKSGNLIPGAELSLYPSYGSNAKFRGEIRTQTNARGEFVVKGLEPVEYRVRIEGAAHPDTKITKTPDGRTRYQGSKSITLKGDQAGPIDIRVQLKPDSRLSPLERD